MSSTNMRRHSEASEPRRRLSSDFTERAIHQAVTAKRRATWWQQSKELYTLKSLKFLKTVPGAIVATVAVVASSAGVYALSNWFDGDVTVTQTDPSILTVDMSSCKSPRALPAGVDPANGLQHVQFKITGSPHISADQLQQELLANCENSAVVNFYGDKFPDAGFSGAGHATVNTQFHYLLMPAAVVRLGSDGTVTIRSTGTKAMAFGTRTLTLAPDATVFNAGKAASINDLRPGDYIQVVAYSAGTTSPPTEGVTILDARDVQIKSLFKTQYNDGQLVMYDTGNVMPLDVYEELQRNPVQPVTPTTQK